ncbi:MAG: alpha/beta hydrolase [Spirochaetales bacterium]|nr:alpha/beta hydrolase [Spirochaetales bacterium]
MKLSTLVTISSVLLLIGALVAGQTVRYIQAENRLLDVEYEGEVIRDLRYGEAERNLYDLYLPEDTGSEKATHLILFIHGGSWTSGDKADGEQWSRNLAAQGYTTASMSYTLQSATTNTNISLINDEVKAAVAAIKEKCAEIGIDLADMAINGFSAGACQAMLYGFKEKDSSPLPIRFIIQESGPTTFNPEVWRGSDLLAPLKKALPLDGSAEHYAAWVSLFSGQSVTPEMVENGEAEAIWKSISPYTYIDEDSVPIVFAYGALDMIVPPESRSILEIALDEAGVTYDSIVLPHSGHGLKLDLSRNRQFLDKVHEYCEKYF